MTERTTSAQAVKRRLNDGIAASAASLDTDPQRPQIFLCECDDLTCVGRVEIPRRRFGELRRLGLPLVSLDCISTQA